MVEATPASLTKAKNHLTIGFESHILRSLKLQLKSGRNLQLFIVKLELEDCDGIQDYIDLKMSLANQITSTGFVIDENWLGESLLMGLPKSMDSFVMGVRGSGVTRTGSVIMSKLLELSVDNDGSAFAAKSKGKKKKEFKCWNCDKSGHFEDDCRQPQSENRSQGGKSH